MKITDLNGSYLSRRSLLAGAVSMAVTNMIMPRLSFAGAVSQNGEKIMLKTRIYGDAAYPVWYRRPLPLNAPRARYPGFAPGITVLKKGTVRREGARPLPCDILFERDVALKMRDGITIYTDVFRPIKEGKYPALVAWSPYGKEIGGQWLDDIQERSGVPLDWVSELQKFEGPDPAFWVNEGYVILNPDPRGAYKSEGNISYWGRQLAEDGYDFIEWAAQQSWSSGKVGMAGNSWLAVSQWFIAAEQPPHLTAIAPWEGFVDHFRETGNRGGIPAPAFPEVILKSFAGGNLVEDQPRMIMETQLMDPYWEDKKARLERIKIPTYVVASYTNHAHTHGSFAGYRQIASEEKWLRVNNTNEWLDFYTPKYAHELLAFFDHYLKGANNGWEQTPRVRICVLDAGGTDIVDRIEDSWPLPKVQMKRMFISGNGQLDTFGQSLSASLSYEVSGEGKTELHYTFTQETEIIGYMKLKLWVEARGSEDMELEVGVEKRDKNGKPYERLLGEGVKGPVVASGLLRVSQRALDPERTTNEEPLLLHTHEEKLKPGEIVPVEIGIWPMAMRYHPGEELVLTIAAQRPIPTSIDMGFGSAIITLPASGGTFTPGNKVKRLALGGDRSTLLSFVSEQQVQAPMSRNAGTHVIHFGGKYDSYLQVPFMPKDDMVS
ncbi:CocE/NonD family hydrolase [Sodalis sp. RH22]|uniref:CocE/NonD family hydrolase n=1 Tax=unclassified Sodalis (in: enterobacteria) TaxID=2636512 RepID=UPI0039B60DC4